MKASDEHRKAYVKHVIGLYERGEDNAFEAFLAAYTDSHPRKEGESDLEYVHRCAEQDYHDGELGAAVYQEVYDELCLAG
jgi:hypothetical protein